MDETAGQPRKYMRGGCRSLDGGAEKSPGNAKGAPMAGARRHSVLRRLLAAVALQDALAQAEGGGGDLHHLVLADEFERLLEVHDPRRHQADGVVGAGSAHVGELLFLGDVDVEV